jgi:hypothetical protein
VNAAPALGWEQQVLAEGEHAGWRSAQATTNDGISPVAMSLLRAAGRRSATATTRNVRHEHATIFSLSARVCPEFVGRHCKWRIFPAEFGEGDGLKNRRLASFPFHFLTNEM